LAKAHGVDVGSLLESHIARRQMAADYRDAYRRYCWPVASLADLRLAPFHILATEGKLHSDREHIWHMGHIHRICGAGSGLLLETRHLCLDLGLDLAEPAARAKGVEWWESLTAAGGEGMVVKPKDFIARGSRGLAQPAVKCRGREYLRIIYGPEYTDPGQIERLRERGLATKRSMALREFALGIEGLRRFIAGAPLRRVHECVFGVLALESEPVDPRL
jgi:protein phosphatase